ncbi:cytochrome P450 [Microbaculum sp. FT89]|uniref:cytochrome P450 n=1 Tax=Microbaculum sp. FT89 TaxID=3447298 RepID=UPI003F53046A
MALTASTEPIDFNPASSDFVRDPYSTLLALQRDDPAHWSPRLKAWILTRYEDVRNCLSSSDMSVDRIRPFYESLPDNERSVLAELMRYLTLWLVFRDPPEHTRLRQLMSRAFTVRAVQALKPGITELCEELSDALPRGEEFDFVDRFAMQLPGLVIMNLLGVPRENMQRLKSCSDRMQLFIGSARNAPDKYERAAEGAHEMAEFFRALIAERRREPRDDLISAFIAAREADEEMTEDELVAACMLVMFGGHETTTNLLAGGLSKFIANPAAWRTLAEDPSLSRQAVEECLRLDGPSGSMARVVAREHILHGKSLRPDDRVFAMINAANQDPDVFDEPQRFDIQRKPNRHLTFGFGPHFCMGAALARLEAEIAFAHLAQKFPDIGITPQGVEWHATIIMRGPRVLPIIIR